MSTVPKYAMTFADEKGMLCAVRKDYCTEDAARKIAAEKLYVDNVAVTNDYKYMHHGFGKTPEMKNQENTWWLTEDMKNNSVSVYVFREAE